MKRSSLNIELRVPTSEDQKIVMDYKQEFLNSGDSMDGTAGLSSATSYDDWYQSVLDNGKKESVREGLVVASHYLCIRKPDNSLVGMINIRHRLNDFLLNFGGHIGYSIRRSERRKGYATEMLRLALIKCRDLSLDRILITCDKENFGSAKTILNNGGMLENEVSEGDGVTQRYWVEL